MTGQKIPCCNEKFLFTGKKGTQPPSWSDPHGEIVVDPKWMVCTLPNLLLLSVPARHDANAKIDKPFVLFTSASDTARCP